MLTIEFLRADTALIGMVSAFCSLAQRFFSYGTLRIFRNHFIISSLMALILILTLTLGESRASTIAWGLKGDTTLNGSSDEGPFGRTLTSTTRAISPNGRLVFNRTFEGVVGIQHGAGES